MLSPAWGCSVSSVRPGYSPRGQRLTSPHSIDGRGGGSITVLDGHRLSQTGRASAGELGRPGTEGCFPRWSHRAGETGLQKQPEIVVT